MGRDHSVQCKPSAKITGLGTGRVARPAGVGAPKMRSVWCQWIARRRRGAGWAPCPSPRVTPVTGSAGTL